MKTHTLRLLSLALISAVIAAIAAMRWVGVVTSISPVDCGLLNCVPTIVKLLPLALAISLVAAFIAFRSAFITSGASFLLGAGIFGSLQYFAYSLSQSNYQSVLVTISVVALAVTLIMLRRQRSIAAAAIVVGVNTAPWMISSLVTPNAEAAHFITDAFTADTVAQMAAQLATPPPVAYWLRMLMMTTALVAVVSVARAWITKSDVLRHAVHGTLVGVFAGCSLCILLLTAYTVTLYSGFDFNQLLLVIPLLSIVFVTSIYISINACRANSRYALLKVTPVILIVLHTTIVGAAFYGSSDYTRIETLHNDTTWAYIHFDSTGSWRRTIDNDSNINKLWHTLRFVETYPYSVYRPAALLKLAEYQFQSWQFREASQTFARAQKEYPHLRSRIAILRSMADFAVAKDGTILQNHVDAPQFERWRRSQGAQLAAYAAIRQNQPSKAIGYFSFYIDYLRCRQPALWTESALASVNTVVDNVMDRQESQTQLVDKSAIQVSVLMGDKPISGARIALVQPHFDAALPNDSRQFTGPWSIPAWNGCWGITDDNGAAVISDVPCGKYEVVLGLDYRICPPRYVVSQPVKSVVVSPDFCRLVDIELSPAIDLVSPKNGGYTNRRPLMRWRPRQDAATYAVSVIKVPWQKFSPSMVAPASSQATCWAKSGIVSCQTTLDPEHFLDGTDSLEQGRSYMWIVYAYDSNGVMVSSSEHYYDLKESMFTVR